MSLFKTGISALGKFITVLALSAAFIIGLVGVVYMSLRGEEIKIPEVIGKDFETSEKELAALGLKVKRIANRYSSEKPDTILEQRPQPGTSAKTGLMISVIVAQPNPEGTEAPAEIKKKTDQEKIDEIEELISDKPKTAKKSNSAVVKKKSSTTRDVIPDKSNQNSDNSADGNSDSSKSDADKPAQPKDSKPPAANSATKPPAAPGSDKPNPGKNPAANKPASGDTRPRKTPPGN